MNPNIFEMAPLDLGISKIQHNLIKHIKNIETDVFERFDEIYESCNLAMPLFSIEICCFADKEKDGIVLQFIFKSISGKVLEKTTKPLTRENILIVVENQDFLFFCKRMTVQLLGDEVLDEELKEKGKCHHLIISLFDWVKKLSHRISSKRCKFPRIIKGNTSNKHAIVKIAHNKTIKVLGTKFHGIDEVIEYARKGIPNKGVYVGEDSERYPCFDSSDYVYEKRRYWNFVFAQSSEELKKKRIALLLKKSDVNYKKLTEELAPMIYWEGDPYYPIEIME